MIRNLAELPELITSVIRVVERIFDRKVLFPVFLFVHFVVK